MVIILSVVILSVVMLSVDMLIVVKLSVFWTNYCKALVMRQAKLA
jgi:hypothetical protein